MHAIKPQALKSCDPSAEETPGQGTIAVSYSEAEKEGLVENGTPLPEHARGKLPLRYRFGPTLGAPREQAKSESENDLDILLAITGQPLTLDFVASQRRL